MKYIIEFLLIGTLYGCFNKPHSGLKTGLEGKVMPSFELLLVDSIHKLNTRQIPEGEPVVLFLFSPHCPFCRALTEDITHNIKSLNGIRFYIISSYPLDQLKNYHEEFKLERYPNVIMGQDYSTYLQTYFNATGVPYVAIYDKNKKLKEAFLGGINSKIIKQIAFK